MTRAQHAQLKALEMRIVKTVYILQQQIQERAAIDFDGTEQFIDGIVAELVKAAHTPLTKGRTE